MHLSAVFSASFFASLVESAEALTIVLAMGVSRDWKSALSGSAVGLLLLMALGLILGPTLSHSAYYLSDLKLAIGILLLLFGLRWLRKAVLRLARRIPLHDEAKIYRHQLEQMGSGGPKASHFDLLAFGVSLKAVMIEGIEVLFIVIALGTADQSLYIASLAALAAVAVIVLLGITLHKPMTRIPENTLKFTVSIILTSFGIYWIGEGFGLHWFMGELSLVALILLTFLLAASTAKLLKKKSA